MTDDALPPRRSAPLLTLMIAAWLLAGCASGGGTATTERIGPTGISALTLQSEVMGYADTFGSIMAQAADQVEVRADPVARLQVHQWKVRSISGAYSIAIDPNPLIALIDMTVMVTLTRDSLERRLGPSIFHENDGILLAAAQSAETLIWTISERVLEPRYVEQLHGLIDAWREEHPDQFYVSYIRIDDFAGKSRGELQSATATSGNILSLLQLDPLAGLNPAVREIQQTRMLAERGLFFASRAPILLGWHAEQLVYETAATPEARQLLEDSNQLTEVAQQFATLAEQLPDQVATEREATINQIQQVITEERTGLLRDIDAAQGNVRGTLVELRETIESGTRLSESLDATITRADTLASRMKSDKPADAPPAKPLDLAEVRGTMTDATVTARQLQDLVESLDALLVSPDASRRFTDIEQLVAASESSAARLVTRIFVLLALLVILIFIASVVRIFIGRRAAARAAR